MKLTRKCYLNGKFNTMDIPSLTPELLVEGEEKMAKGELIQNAFNFLNPGEREFLLTGITPELWEEIFGSPEDEE